MRYQSDHNGSTLKNEGARITEPQESERFAASPVQPGRAKQLRRSYLRWLRLSRLALAAFVVIQVAAFFWLLPWLPGGLDTADYTPELALTIYLLSGAAFAGVLVAASREVARRYGERIVAWAAVYDEESGLHSREYLYDRVALECEQAARNNTVFSVLAVRFRVDDDAPGRAPAIPDSAMELAADIIDGIVRPGDLVARLSDHELAILARTVDESSRNELALRITKAATEDLGAVLGKATAVEVVAGGATFGADGYQAEELISVARNAAKLCPSGSLRVA